MFFKIFFRLMWNISLRMRLMIMVFQLIKMVEEYKFVMGGCLEMIILESNVNVCMVSIRINS